MRRAATAVLVVAGVLIAPPPASAANEVAVEVAASLGRTTCAVTGDGGIQCWGSNTNNQFGNGGVGDIIAVPVDAGQGIDSATAITGGNLFGCAAISDGGVRCWGYNFFGQLGNGTSMGSSSVPVDVTGISTAVDVSAGSGHSCAVLADGGVRCWGRNDGRLGRGAGDNSSIPVEVENVSTAVSVSANDTHSCALLSGGGISCWGHNTYGQLGDGTGFSNRPVAVLNIDNAVSVATGTFHSCAALADGGVKCWGRNFLGELGDGTTSLSATPVQVPGINNAVAVSAGFGFSCALLSSGEVRCWGYQADGRVGDGVSDATSILVPVPVIGISDAVQLSTGSRHSCAVLSDGGIKCWGAGGQGQMGQGSSADAPEPVDVIGLGPARNAEGFVLLDPCLVWDSSTASSPLQGPLLAGAINTIQVTGSLSGQGGANNCAIPAGVTAVVVNVKAKDALLAGNVRVLPEGANFGGTSGGVVNFAVEDPQLNNSNMVVVPVSPAGRLSVRVNAGPLNPGQPAVDSEITVVGYIQPDAGKYSPITPCAFADSRSGTGAFGGRYMGAESRTVQVSGVFGSAQGGGNTDCGVPADATGVMMNLVAVGADGHGEIGTRPMGASGSTTFVDFAQLDPVMNNSNAVFSPLLDGKVDLFSVAGAGDSVHVRAIALGYISPTGADSYTPISACAAFDSRFNQGASGSLAGRYLGGETRTMQLVGFIPLRQGGGTHRCNIPQNATSVLINIVAVNPLQDGNLKASAAGVAPSGGILNFAALSPPLNNSNAVVVPIANGQIDISANGGPHGLGQPLAHVRGVVLGYFTPSA